MSLETLRQPFPYVPQTRERELLLRAAMELGLFFRDLSRGSSRYLVALLSLGWAGSLALLGSSAFGLVILRPFASAVCITVSGLAFLCLLRHSQRTSQRAIEALDTVQSCKAALEGSEGVVLRWDLVSGDLRWFGDAARLLQCDSGQIPINFRDLRPYLHPDESLYNSVSHALRTAKRHVSWMIRLRDGDQGWAAYQLCGEIASGDRGSAPSFIGVLVPAHAALPLRSEDRGDVPGLSTILETLPISFVIWSRDNRLVLCNRKFRQLYRIPAAAAQPGASLEELKAAAEEAILQAPPQGQGAQGRFQLGDKQLADGTWLHIAEYWTSDGAIVSVGTDITVLKISENRIREREQEMLAMAEGFEQSRRQLEIQTRKLQALAESYSEEKSRAEAANRAKSEFLANVSHELRTPLNAIIGFSEMMQEGVLGPLGNKKYEGYVRDINESGRYLLEMINDILDMSKIEAGRMTLAREWVNLTDLFRECLTVIHPSARARNVKLITGGNPEVSVYGDKRALKQVLINLLSNAVKFTLPRGKVTLRVYRYRGSVRIAITDTGVGIATHDLGRLGKPFEQVESQLTKGHKGTGLGLAISRSLVELHGGKLDIKSKVGEGTTVTCILPAYDEKEVGCKAA